MDGDGLRDRVLVGEAGKAGRRVGAAARRDDGLGSPEVGGPVAAALGSRDRS
jgi:hypothetical protein